MRRSRGGRYVLLAGPDGSGKSSLVRRLTELRGQEFPTVLTMHWRPGMLPTLGRMAGLAAPDPTRPHDRPPYGLPVSLIRLVYYWVDQVAGYWVRIWPCWWRGGLVVMERGYWDILVDPARYRLRCPFWIVRLLGMLVPRPHLTFILGGRAGVIAARKDELPAEEIARQLECWRRVRLPRSLWLDGELTEQAVFDRVATRLCPSDTSVEGADAEV